MTKKDLFNAINNMDEKYIHDAQDVYKEPQKPEVIRISEGKRQPYWKTIFATALCTAAAMFAVFVPIVRSGAFGFLAPADSQTSESDSSGVVLSNSGNSESSNVVGSEIKIDLEKETNYEVVLNAVFAYDKEGNTFKRYKWGDKFTPNQLLMGGRSYFRNENGEWRIYRQELALSRFMPLELDCVTIKSIKEGAEIHLRDSLSEKLGLPNFFKTSPNKNDTILHADEFIGNTDSKTIRISSIDITVDYDTNTINISSDWVTAF